MKNSTEASGNGGFFISKHTVVLPRSIEALKYRRGRNCFSVATE